MDRDSIGIIIIMVVLVAMSGFFSATETAFSSLNRIRIKNMADNGDRRAAKVFKLTADFDKLLSTVLVGNNIVNIALASIATVFFTKLIGSGGATLSTVVITVAVLIFGEISPKSLAKESPEKFAVATASIIRVLIVLLTPLNWIFGLWKALLRKIFRISDTPSVTEEELLTMVEEAEQDGEIDHHESDLIRSAIEFDELQADDIYTPRVDIEGVDKTDSCDHVASVFSETGFSRLPVYDGTLDSIIGVIHLKDFYTNVYPSGGSLDAIIKPIPFIAGSMKIDDLLRLLQKEKSHMAVIADEFGGTLGIVTMEDILEELVGEIWDEHDEIVEELQTLDDGRYRIAGSMSLRAMLDELELESDSEATTVSGWAMEALDRIPEEGDTFEADGLSVTVTKTDGRRLLEIVATRLPEESDASS
ncbi:MAG: HlyC/CorC family transporter [Clostridia bacterium]|nr:HlyC/CorC family transporter [Clostridia bacterium]